jgi:hypothetical protein
MTRLSARDFRFLAAVWLLYIRTYLPVRRSK